MRRIPNFNFQDHCSNSILLFYQYATEYKELYSPDNV